MSANYNIKELQLRILDILLAVDKVCRENNLRYYIMAGTLIGAVRHKGFIPWDDDLDIGMPRKDYEIFMKKSKELLPSYLEAIYWKNDPEYPLSFAKIQDARTTLVERKHIKYKGGIYMDVFPLDGVPAGKVAQIMHFFRFEFYNKALYFISRDPFKHGKGVRSWPTRLCRFFFTKKEIQTKLEKLMTRYDYDRSGYVCDYDDGRKGIMPKSVLGTPATILFEGKEVWGVENYDAYLSNKYGNYMQIPPVEKQRQHNFYFLDLNKPYRE